MKKLICYYFSFCLLGLSLSACHSGAGHPNAQSAKAGAMGQESAGSRRSADRSAGLDATKSADQQTYPEKGADKVNSSDKDKLAASSTVSEETKSSQEDYILPDSSTRRYSLQELESLSPRQMELARNEIYARHGRRFKDQDLQSYFQGKTWYHGTIEPSDFDDNQLNETERANISLLLRAEQKAKGETRENTKTDHDSKPGSAVAGYTDIVNKNQYRQVYLRSNGAFDEAEPHSQVIDHGSYYEVTHGEILADTCYDGNLMEGKGVGDTLQIGDTTYRIMKIVFWNSGDGFNVIIESGPNTEDQYMLSRSFKDNYYIRIGEDDDTDKDSLYTGSLYFSKDCIVTAPDPNDGYGVHTIPASDFFTKAFNEIGAEFGLSSDGLDLWGSFNINPSGLITSYNESFLS